jgi:hypothetical protein
MLRTTLENLALVRRVLTALLGGFVLAYIICLLINVGSA